MARSVDHTIGLGRFATVCSAKLTVGGNHSVGGRVA